ISLRADRGDIPCSSVRVLGVTPPSRMLGGRVPDSLFKEFQYAKMAAETATGIRRVTTEDAVAAFVRMLRDPQMVERWHAELLEVRKNR
ncbi:hypothetical protein ACFOPQ_20510, partial [Deinococcus antarcticus]